MLQPRKTAGFDLSGLEPVETPPQAPIDVSNLEEVSPQSFGPDQPEFGRPEGGLLGALTPEVERHEGPLPGAVHEAAPLPTPQPLGSIRRGVNRAQQAFDIGLGELGILEPDEVATNFAENQRSINASPLPLASQEVLQELGKTEGLGDSLALLFQNPEVVGSVVGESLPLSVPSLGLGAAGTLVGPTGTIAGLGVGSAATEYTVSLAQALSEAGVDPANRFAVEAALRDPEFLSQAREKAVIRGAVIGTVDAATAGTAGRIAGPIFKAAGGGVGGTAAAGAVTTGLEALGGGGGEAIAQVASGDELNIGEVALEGIAEVVPGTVESGLSIASNAAQQAAQKPPSTEGLELVEPVQEIQEAVVQEPVTQDPLPEPTGDPESQIAPTPAQGVETQPAPVQAPEPVQASDLVQNPQITKIKTPNNEVEIEVAAEVVEADTLVTSDQKEFPKELQPRDREQAASETQIASIAGNLNPEQLGASPTSDIGSPIVGADNVVESGNGRVAALRRIAALEDNEQVRAYREYIESLGFDTKAFKSPILVRRRTTELTPDDRIRFTQLSNEDNKLGFNASERARNDSSKLTPEIFESFRGGNILSSENSDFRRSFTKQVLGGQKNLANFVDQSGKISQEGVRRIGAAVSQYAYDNSNLVNDLFLNTEADQKSISGALLDAAGEMGRVRAGVQSGQIKSNYDLSKPIAAAVSAIRSARQKGGSLSDELNQQGFFEDASTDPLTERLVRVFSNSGLSRVASKKSITDALRGYAQTVNDFDPNQGDLISENSLKSPEEILESLLEARQSREGSSGQQGRLVADATPAPTAVDDATPRVEQDATEATPDKTQNPDPSQQSTQASDQKPTDETKPDSEPEADLVENSKSDPNEEFTRVSFTQRVSKFRQLFEDAGVDPVRAENFPPKRQAEIAKRQLKKRFGVTVNFTTDIPIREAIDQMLDAYVQFQALTHITGLPDQAIALEGIQTAPDGSKIETKLSLELNKSRRYLGAFQPATKKIMLPRRSNSFGHEWGHALDFFLVDQMEVDEVYSGYSDAVRKDGDEFWEPGSVSEAFAHLMNAIFFDKGKQAARLAQIEQQMERATSPITKEALQAEIDKIKSGASRSRKDRSDYYNSALAFGRSNPGNASYWTQPTEMLARAFEAWLGFKLEQTGLSSEFLSKGNSNYLRDDGARFAQTFPKASDRLHIFNAFDRVFDQIAESRILNKGDHAPSNKPDMDLNVIDPLRWDRLEIGAPSEANAVRRMVQKEREGYRREVTAYQKMAERPASPVSRLAQADQLRGMAFSSIRSLFRTIENQNPGKSGAVIKQIADKLVTRPGRPVAVGQTFTEHSEQLAGRNLNSITKINEKHKLEDMSATETKALSRILLGRDAKASDFGIKSTRWRQLEEAANGYRQVFNRMWFEMDKAGMEVGYVKSESYLPRITDDAQVQANELGFLKDASKAYTAHEFTREVSDTTTPEGLEAFNKALEFVNQRARKFAGQGTRGFALPNEFKLRGAGAHTEAQAFRKAHNKLVGLLESGADQSDIDAQIDAINEILDAGFYDELSTAWGKFKAYTWFTRMMLNTDMFFDKRGPEADFTKSRKLTSEFYDSMGKWYVTDPRELAQTYIMSAAQRAAYSQRFDGKPGSNNHLSTLLNRMFDEGAQPGDIELVENLVQTLTRHSKQSAASSIAQPFLGTIHTLGTLVLLPRAVIASLAEPMTAGVRTGNLVDSFTSLGRVFRDVFSKTAEGSDKARRQELAEFLGITSNHMIEHMIANRFGGTFRDSPRNQAVLANFFNRTWLTPLTAQQRRATLGTAELYIHRMSKKLLDSEVDAKTKAAIRDELAELGIGQDIAQDFAQWMVEETDGKPRIEDVEEGRFGEQLGAALIRYLNQVIQNPNAGDRPYLANNPLGRVVYSITSFTYSFYENVTKRAVVKVWETGKRDGASAATQEALIRFAPALLSLMAAQAIVSAARLAIFNPDRWDEWEEDDELAEKLLLRGLSASGVIGPMDPFYNSIFGGLKYQRDLSNVFVGAHGGHYLQALQRILQGIVTNNPNTNTGEYNQARGFYDLMVAPAIAYALASVPGGPVLGKVYGGASMYTSSADASNDFARLMVGEKGERTDGTLGSLAGPSTSDLPKFEGFD